MSEAMLTVPATPGDAPLPRRNGARSMVPSTWVNRQVLIEYVSADGSGVSTSAVLLDWCGLGIILNIGGGRTIVPWDVIRLVELREA